MNLARWKRALYRNVYLTYTILFAILGVLIFWYVLFLHGSLIFIGDEFNENYPILAYLGDFYRNLIPNILRGDPQIYDVALGYGDNVIGTLNFYGLGDVFTLIAALFPKQYTSWAFTLITVLRFYVAGLAFIWYGQYKGYSRVGQVCGALIYCYSYFAMGLGLTAHTFPTLMVYFPVLVLGIDRILDEAGTSRSMAGTSNDTAGSGRRHYLWAPLVLAVFLQSMSVIYFMYMDLILCGSYLLIRGFCGLKQGWITGKGLWSAVVRAAVHVCVGIGLSAFLFVPVVLAYLGSPRMSQNVTLGELFGFPNAETMSELVRNVITPAASGYEEGLSIMILTLVIIVFFLRRLRKFRRSDLAIVLITVLVSYFYPLLGTVMNGFSYHENRWIYAMYFAFAAVTARYLDTFLKEYDRNDVILSRILMAVFVASQMFVMEGGHGAWIRLLVFASVWSILNSVLMRGWIGRMRGVQLARFVTFREGVVFLLLLNVMLVGFYMYSPTKLGGRGIGSSSKSMSGVIHEVMDSQLAQNGIPKSASALERVDLNDTALDAPLMLGMPTTFSYYSISSGTMPLFALNSRINPSIFTEYLRQGVDNRQIFESLLSVRKLAVDKDTSAVVENNYFLPFGFTYDGDAWIASSDADTLNPLERMGIQMDTLILKDPERAWNESSTAEEISALMAGDGIDGQNQAVSLPAPRSAAAAVQGIQIEEIPIEPDYSGVSYDGVTMTAGAGATVPIRVSEVPEDSTDDTLTEYYLILRGLKGEPEYKNDIDVGDKQVRVWRTRLEWYYQDNYDYYVEVTGAVKRGDLSLRFVEPGALELAGIELVKFTMPAFAKQYEARRSCTLQNLDIRNSSIRGSLSNDSAKWLYLTLPYDSGWSCSIDGSEAKILQAGDSFMAVYVEPGEHQVLFNYQLPGFKVGAVISLCALAVWALVLLMETFAARRNSKA